MNVPRAQFKRVSHMCAHMPEHMHVCTHGHVQVCARKCTSSHSQGTPPAAHTKANSVIASEHIM